MTDDAVVSLVSVAAALIAIALILWPDRRRERAARTGMVTIGDAPRTAAAPCPPRPTERRQRESSRHYHTGVALAEVRHAIHNAESEAYLLPLLEVEAQLESLVTAGWREMQERDARTRGGAA